MERLHFSITIHAPREKIWKVLWDDSTYRKWTSVFSEGSYAETDWKEGSKVRFLTPEGHGMFSKIAKHIPNEYMLIKHMGEIKDGKEQPSTEETKKWEGSEEDYLLKDKGEDSELFVNVDSTEDHTKIFLDKFPKALDALKNLCEN